MHRPTVRGRAHVHADAGADAAPGSTAVLTFRVPGESEKGALTTGFSVALPDVASAQTEIMPDWTAAPTVGISPDQFAPFNVSVSLPDQQSVTLPATQTYSGGALLLAAVGVVAAQAGRRRT